MTVTTRAREALADCEYALTDFEASANTVFQRPRWVSVMTLLRTVEYVLKDVDGKNKNATPEVRRYINAAVAKLYASKAKPRKPRIFHEFIRVERNDVVHLYEVRPRVNVRVRPGVGGLEWQPVVSGAARGGSAEYAPTIYEFVMRDGPFKGRDPRELCREAIAFWKEYLDAIDAGT
jgi:hypothetical protein